MFAHRKNLSSTQNRGLGRSAVRDPWLSRIVACREACEIWEWGLVCEPEVRLLRYKRVGYHVKNLFFALFEKKSYLLAFSELREIHLAI